MNIEAQFQANQKDLSLDDAKVQWVGRMVRLHEADRPNSTLAMISISRYIVHKIKTWCVKNSFRCSQIDDDNIIKI